MNEFERIRVFLGTVRRRALVEAMLRTGGATGATMVAALLLMAMIASGVGPAAFWPTATFGVMATLVMGGVGLALIRAWRLRRDDRVLAHLVGTQMPELRSDLLSAVELGTTSAAPEGASFGILQAFYTAVATAVTPVKVQQLIPLGRAARRGLILGLMGALLTAGFIWAPGTIRRGLALLTHTPTRFEGAIGSTDPIIGDVKLVYTFPPYTGLPRRVVEGSSGDIVALKGTKVQWEAPAFLRAREALFLLGEQGEAGERPVVISKGVLSSSLTITENQVYRVWLSPLLGRPVREARGHRIVVEADQPPRVEIFGPADRLQLATPKPIEVGYAASDDFGLGDVDLVWRADDGVEQRQRLRDGAGKRSDQGKTVFEPDWARLGQGATVSYRIEAKDRDEVSGAKVGTSRTLFLVIENPREDLDEQLHNERAVLEKLIDNLAERLELHQHPPGTAGGAVDLVNHLGTWAGLHEAEETQIAGLGRIIDDEKRGGAASKGLLQSLSEIADRLGKRLREENDLLGALKKKTDEGALGATAFAKLFDHGKKHTDDLETSVLLLDDLIGRQRLEDLAALAKDLTQAFDRLKDLLARFESTKDEALRRQLEREIRDLKARIEELASKVAAVKARNEVSTEWQNMPDMKAAEDKAQKFMQALEKGDSRALKDALGELGDALKDIQGMLQKNSDDFGGERFPQEQQAMNDLKKKIGDLEGDERALAGDGKALVDELDEESKKKLEGKLGELSRELEKQADELRRKLTTPMPRELNDDAEDELKKAQESAKQLKRLLPDRDWGEAKKEAERASASLRKVNRAVDERDKGKGKKPRSQGLEEFSKQAMEAGGLAQDLAQKLNELAPKSGEKMSQGQKQRAAGMAERQKTLGAKAKELSKEAPDLRSVAEQMGQAAEEFEGGQPREGAGKAKDAADRLAKLREGMEQQGQQGRQGTRGRSNREPVRIPGADDSRAPREWRQELMEAMREHAPERYQDEVRKYYEDLVK